MDFLQMITAIVTNGIGAVCAGAVLWFAYYRETKTIPYIMKTFADSQNKALETFREVVSDERKTCQTWHEENRARLDRLSEEARENRHLLKEMSHQLGMREALDKARQKTGIRKPPAEEDN